MNKVGVKKHVLFISIIVVAIFTSGVWLGRKIVLRESPGSLRMYKEDTLDLSYPYIGIRSVALRYLYALKQGIFRSGIATVTIYGRVLGIGSEGDVQFQIHLRHVTDVFENTITPDVYISARVVAYYNQSKKIEAIGLSDIKLGEVVEVVFDLDLLTGFETIQSITVFRDEGE